MSGSDNSSSSHVPSPHSRPTSKAQSMELDQSVLTHDKSTTTSILNVLFLGETSIGRCSIIDLIAGSGEKKRMNLFAGPRTLGYDMRSFTLGRDTFRLHTTPKSGFMSLDTLKNTLKKLREDGGIHLLVYCINASHPTSWIRDIHRVVGSSSIRIPTVAVIGGLSDATQHECWWSNNKDLLTEGLHFHSHLFIRMDTRSPPTGDHDSENRHDLQALILENCAPDSETRSNFRRTTPYKQQSIASSLSSLFVTLASKNSPRASAISKAINIVLLGESGVGKSSLINLIAKKELARVSPDTMPCTKTAVKYTFQENGRSFHLYDTPGLVEPQLGIEDFVNPIVTIQELIRGLDDGNGPDLLLYCVDNSKPTTALRRNYRLFCKIMCRGKVSFTLAITKLEEGQDAKQWWRQHRPMIQKYGVDCSGHIGFRRERGHVDVGQLEGQPGDSLLAFFVAHTNGRKNGIWPQRSSLGSMADSATPGVSESTLEKALKDKCDLDEQTARELATRLVSSIQSGCDDAHT